MKKTHSIASMLVATVACAFTAAPALAAETGASDRSIITDSRGRPPFQRSRVSASAEFARLEESAAARRDTSFRGRPPFARAPGDAAAADFARFEETTDTRKRRPGPPGKTARR